MTELIKIVHAGPPPVPNLEMTLYCWEHGTTHELTIEEVEQLVYSLNWMERVAHEVGAMDPIIGRSVARRKPECLWSVLAEGNDPERGQDAVLQGIQRREAGA